MTTAMLEAVAWKDGKRHAWLMGLLIPSLPLLGWALVAATGLSVFWWTGPIFYFLIIPPLELLIGEDRNNPPDGAVERLENDRYYRYCTFLYLPLQYASLIGSAYVVARGGLSWLDVLGIALTTGLSSGVGINAAHELGHKKPALERWLAKVALAPTAYGHFFVEHNRGHHVRVATPEDPASSRLGESFWAFLPRTVVGSARSAWNLEKERLGRSGLGPWTLRNDVLNAWLMSVVLFGGLILWLGPVIIPFLLIQAAYGFMLLEVVNYLEHYGLVRQKQADGRYERCQPQHSWNSNHVVTNLLLYHLQRHSDHHTNPTRRYQALRHFEQSPQLPSGYASMVALAYIPPLWRWVMDRRVLAHYQGDVTRANVYPPQRRKILARYGAGAGPRD
ncbi:alkane 1-monooxygenase [Nevskia soli]|uniref:alkane 1-monooxygenase n=1 Tax=Nevskia soli TaxID=418856 RepID=UPI0004A74B5C|nr:alkane 1-monooxygenase [Nevskia soli]